MEPDDDPITPRPFFSHSLTPVRCACSNGLRLGALMGALCLCWAATFYWPLASLVTLVLIVAVPFVAWRLLRNDYEESPMCRTVAALWLDGLMSMLLGGVLAAFVLFVFTRWCVPGYLDLQWQNAVAILSESPDPDMQLLAANCRAAARNGFSISPIIFAMTVLWMVAFTGSLLSLLLAFIVKISGRRAERAETFNDDNVPD